MTEPIDIMPDWYPRAVELANEAFHAAYRDDDDAAADAWRALGAECGNDGVITGLIAMCDTLIAAQGRTEGVAPVRVAFLSECGAAALNPAHVPPEVAWSSRLIAARTTMSEDAFADVITELPEDSSAVGAHVMMLTAVVARTVRGIREGTLPDTDQVISAAAAGTHIDPDAKRAKARRALASVLAQIEAADTDYELRYGLVLRALVCADRAGYAAGVRIDAVEPDWPVAYVELPTGQVSWHLPRHPNAWDGHTTAQKYERCRAYAATQAAP